MDQKEFNSLFRDFITHLYDFSVLETHLLIGVINLPEGYRGSKGEYFRELIIDEIDRFKPQGKEGASLAMEWRPYHILYKRYVEGISLREISIDLSISERQLRRDNSRAFQALAGRIWDKLANDILEFNTTEDGSGDNQQAFDSNFELLNFNDVIAGIEEVLQKRLEMDGFSLSIELDPEAIHVMSDRIITRQILISLVGYFLNFPCDQEIQLRTEKTDRDVRVVIYSALTDTWSQAEEKDHADLLESARFWSQQVKGEIQISHPSEGQYGNIQLTFSLPQVQQHIVLVVDDQLPTQQMFRRFLNRSAYRVIGTTDPDEAVHLARQFKPSLITLDVMMPKVDGWEILQALKTDLETRDIPILVCSAWEEPELAQSLGAAGFLKKPIRQRDLLAELDRLDL